MQNTKFMKFLNQMERKYGKFAIPNLMTIIVFGMGLVFLLDSFTGFNPDYEYGLTSLLYFDRDAVLHGQIWRILTFLFLPPDSSPFFIVFALYLYWIIGSALEQQWGSFRFNIYYLCGVLGTIISGLITGYATNTFLNLSLYLAFAILFPDFEILLLFFIPVKMKYLAMLEGILIAGSLIFSDWTDRFCILFSLMNVILFFWKDLYDRIRYWNRRRQWRNKK
ncbi:MAG: rhomboid family intramembrane serine protease [Oscillospiraceae bacterium]|nr:rhomboid family intramembrane serine protease [Oscillospiraceae bacterium]